MAPSSALRVRTEEKLLPREKNKLRKPAVEKLRRERINSSIEQLKLLLEEELQRLQPSCRLEKADVLEVAVRYLRQQGRPQEPAFARRNPQQDFNSGYLRCLKEALRFLSYHEPKKEARAQLIEHLCKVQTGPDAPRGCAPRSRPRSPRPRAGKPPARARGAAPAAVWRPWCC